MSRTRDAAPPPNPFPGLRSFDRTEHDRFFGREEHVDELLQRLRSHRFVAVIGASGSGKSSLVRAGVLPALDGGFMVQAGAEWRMALFRPGTDPLGELADVLSGPEVFGSPEEDPWERELERDMTAATLRRSRHGLVRRVREARMAPGENLLVVVDQFEELFRYRAQLMDRFSDEATAFVRLLLTATGEPGLPVYVVITMRSDFLGDCAQFPGLPEAINESQYLVPRLNRSQLERAIKGPVGVGGARISAPLLQQLLNDVSDDPDQLPILQHALMRTFDRWRQEGEGGEPLGLHHYRAIGGMEEALSRHADEAFEELEERLRPVAETVFRSLTERGADGRGVRRPTRLTHLAAVADAAVEEVETVVEVFRATGRTFLMPSPAERPKLSPEEVVDISHESLMRVWRKLSGWVEEEAESARFYRRLLETVRLYPERAGLWRNPELEIAARWRRETRPTAAWAERYGGGFEAAVAFLDESQAVWDAEQRRIGEQRRVERSKRLAFQSDRVLEEDHELALLLAVAAGRAASTDEAERALRRVLDHPGRSRALLRGHGDRVVDVVSLPGRGEGTGRLASAALDGSVVVWDGQTLQPLHRLPGHRTAVRLVQSDDGRHLVTAGIDGTARIWEVGSGRRLHVLEGHRAGIADAAWSRDGAVLATAGQDGTVRLWDTGRGEERAVLRGHGDWVWRVAWVPAAGDGGDRLASAGDDGTARIWDPDGGEERLVLEGHGDKVRDVAWSPRGDRLATAGNDGTARIWDAATGAQLHCLEGHDDWVVAVAWSADGGRLLTASRDATAALWDAATGREQHRLRGHGEGLTAASWCPGDERVLTASSDATARVWDAAGGRLEAVLTGHRGAIRAAGWTGPGRGAPAVVTASEDGTLRLWDPAPGYLRLPPGPERLASPLRSALWSPDGERVATTHQDGTVRIWDARAATRQQVLRLPGSPVSAGSWSRDGGRLLLFSRDRRAAVWDLAAGESRIYEGHRSGVFCGALDPGGERAATGGFDGVLHLWRPADPEGGGGTGDLGGAVVRLAWDGDGGRLATACEDGTVVLWDTSGGSLEPRRLHVLRGPSSVVLALAWDPGFRRLAAVGMDQTVRVWDAESGELEHTLVGHRSWTVHLDWSPDGEQLASAGRDGAVRLWPLAAPDPAAGARELVGHQGPVTRVVFDRTGARIVTAGQDGTVRLWHSGLEDDLRGQEIATLAHHREEVVEARWSPGGDRILTADRGAVRIHLAHPADLVAEAEGRAVRGPDAREAALHGLQALPEEAPPAPAEEAGAPSPSPPPPRPPADLQPPFRVAGILFARNDWAQEVRRGMESGRERARRELGVEVDLCIEQHQFDLVQEIALVDRFLEEGFHALVLSPRDLQASVPKLREAHERGLVVVCVGTSINLRDAARYATSFYESDQFELGYRTGHYLAQWLVDRGLHRRTLDLGIVQCERFEACYQRGRGFREALTRAGVPWRVVANAEGLVLPQARQRAGEMLREHPEILVVFAEHDESTRGAVEAVRELGLAGRVFVFGTDVADSIAQMLQADDDVLQATTGQQARRMGEEGVLDAVRRLLGRDVGPFHKVLASPLYTREPWHAHKLRTWNDDGDRA